MLDRWHNILGTFNLEKIQTDLDDLHKKAEEAGFKITIMDKRCPNCGQLQFHMVEIGSDEIVDYVIKNKRTRNVSRQHAGSADRNK